MGVASREAMTSAVYNELMRATVKILARLDLMTSRAEEEEEDGQVREPISGCYRFFDTLRYQYCVRYSILDVGCCTENPMDELSLISINKVENEPTIGLSILLKFDIDTV